jgi:hypothetical protein
LMPAALTPLPNMLPFPSIMTMIPFSYSITTPPLNPLSFPVAPINVNNPVPPWYPIYFSPYTTELPENPSSLMPIVTLYPTTAIPQYIPPPPLQQYHNTSPRLPDQHSNHLLKQELYRTQLLLHHPMCFLL